MAINVEIKIKLTKPMPESITANLEEYGMELDRWEGMDEWQRIDWVDDYVVNPKNESLYIIDSINPKP